VEAGRGAGVVRLEPGAVSTDGVWASTDLANVTSGKPVAGELVPYAEALANQARLAGYTVKSSNSTVATGS